MLRDIDLEGLDIQPFEGSSLGEKYQPPESTAFEKDEVEGGFEMYSGNCHCGAVKYTLKTKPLMDQKPMSCNCSLCSRVCASFSSIDLHLMKT